jgi:prepilin-type N-terminal cleavage/methylation domain-containing protein
MKIMNKQRKGFTLIELLIVIAVIAILAAIAIPNLLSSRQSANETAAIGAMKALNSAEAQYRTRNRAYGTIANLASSNLVDPALAAATSSSNPRNGYTFNLTVTNASTSYYATATPTTSAGTQQFYTDESGVIFSAATSATTPTTDSSGTAPTGFSVVGS